MRKFLWKMSPKNGKTQISKEIMLLWDGDGGEWTGLGWSQRMKLFQRIPCVANFQILQKIFSILLLLGKIRKSTQIPKGSWILCFFSFRLYEVQETNDSTTQVIIRRIHSRSKRNGFWWRLVFYPPSGVKNFSKTKSQVTTHTNFLYFPRTVHFMIHCTPLYCY